MLRGGVFATPLTRANPFISFFTLIPRLLMHRNYCHALHSLLPYHTSVFAKPISNIQANSFFMDRRTNLCTVAVSATSPVHKSRARVTNTLSNKAKKKARHESPEGVLRKKLDMCSKRGDLVEALHLYDEARISGIQLILHHYNVLLYLCSSSASSSDSSVAWDDSDISKMGLKKGFEIFQQMVIDKVVPNEASFTSAARLANAMKDPEMAFDLVKQMQTFGIPPKLRSYGPALFGFCNEGNADKAYEVDAHMAKFGVIAEEPELSALLKVSADVKQADKVYEMLHRMRASVRQVSESTFGIIEDWFKSKGAAEVGEKNWDVSKVKEGIVRGGGGWHGQGWLGHGRWGVMRTRMDERGVCESCGEKLVCIDLDARETANFASSLSKLACQREVKADFNSFQDWLRQHGPFDAVVDGANVGLINQHEFRFDQLNTVVSQLQQMSRSKKLPLVILHRSRVTGGPAVNPNNKRLLEQWKNSGALYPTPAGSNDDWYWLYAAVSCKSLLVTNDKMRDHLFQLLGTSFFPRWKEKHQVQLSVSWEGIRLQMPPPYSIVIQEAENGSWHVPMNTNDDTETPRQWLCATRAKDTSVYPL
ncbi:RNase_Zc3h12a domain-containing protein/PPR_3 domain-containing protein [Cephalotus follicularis]|uniref:ribonuclease P n=1 Tax=Cephalotus follicularis TaxID=3775 RepID=A0A1Q3BMX4_CEPFO|nr:RNase_Zc3h12a domain-containing protein/PPR_3 domain-containing protein [Cephalotus follicularis]